MISKKKQRIRWLILAIFMIATASLIIGFSLKDGIEYYKSPTQVLSSDISEKIKFRLGGLVEDSSLVKSSGKKISFNITDNQNSIPTSFEGILPDLFAENQGVIASGKYINGVFVAEEILAKHDESYLPKEVIDIVKNLNAQGFSTTIDILGEHINSQEKTFSVTKEYIQLYDDIAKNSVDSNISVKPTHIGLDISMNLVLENFKKLINKASESSNFLRIDMESSKNTDSTFEIYKNLYKSL